MLEVEAVPQSCITEVKIGLSIVLYMRSLLLVEIFDLPFCENVFVPGKSPVKMQPEILDTLHVVYMEKGSKFLIVWYLISVFLGSLMITGPPLWSSGQSSWLQIRGPGFDSRHYQGKKSSGSGTGSTQPLEYN
jgi:hypothetical protein